MMIYFDRKFVAHKNEVHGERVWIITSCNNLSVHLDPEVKQIFGSNKVFLCYLSPKMTNFIQVIDTGLGRSVQLAVGRFLGEWIMGSDNMTVWEGEMTACERRILITIFVSKDPAYVMGSAMESM